MAISRINTSAGRLNGKRFAAVGLATGYIGFICAFLTIRLLLSIAVPNFEKAHQISMQNTCVNNLREIQAAKNKWAFDNNKTQSDVPSADDLTPYLPDHKFPVCPAGGSYVIGSVTNPPTCSFPGHQLPE